jgi:hypothetical protein
MKLGSVFIRMARLIMLVISLVPVLSASAQNQGRISKLTIDDTISVRFLYRRLNANYVLPALIFRVANVGSPNWGTAPINQYGRTPYVSSVEMQSLVRQLKTAHTLWRVSSTKEPIEPFETIGPSENLVVTIYAANGVATSSIPPKDRCKYLSQLNKIIEMKRAHWEFEYFRQGCDCHVPGYRADAYPNNR